jgi:hypothetical protein
MAEPASGETYRRVQPTDICRGRRRRRRRGGGERERGGGERERERRTTKGKKATNSTQARNVDCRMYTPSQILKSERKKTKHEGTPPILRNNEPIKNA